MITKQFLIDLKEMICEKGMEYQAPWSQVPEKYKEDFMSWVGEIKDQNWEGNETRGWIVYCHEYLAFLLDVEIQKWDDGK